jgi:fructose-1,6-bisphosphatase/inositol monophosphatase family enzyme
MSLESELAGFARAMAPAALRAAAIARSLEGRVRNVPKSAEKSAVKQALTAADMAAQEAILEDLVDRYPRVSLAAEEDTASVGRFPAKSRALVVIDPIDGTLRSYLEARGPYAVIVGLAIDRQVVAGIVVLPREGPLFMGERGRGAEWIAPGAEARPVRARADGDRVLVSHSMPERVLGALRAEGLEPVPACGGAIAVAPLVRGVRAGLRYFGGKRKRGISIRGRIGTVIAEEAGAHVAADRGRAFPAHLDDPTRTLRVAADEADLRVLEKALAAGDLA